MNKSAGRSVKRSLKRNVPPPTGKGNIRPPKSATARWIEVTAAFALLILCIVPIALLSGVLDEQGSARELEIGIFFENSGFKATDNEQFNQETFPLIELRTLLATPPPKIINALGAIATRDEIDLVQNKATEAFLFFSFWKDQTLRQLVRRDAYKGVFSDFTICSSKQLDEFEDAKLSIKYKSGGFLGESTVDPFCYLVRVDVLLEEQVIRAGGETSPRILHWQQARFSVPLRFTNHIRPSVGFAQVRWLQGINTNLKQPGLFINSATVNNTFDDIKVAGGRASGSDPTVKVGVIPFRAYASNELKTPTTIIPGQFHDMAEFSLGGASSTRREFINFVGFALAAVFGAALSAFLQALAKICQQGRPD